MYRFEVVGVVVVAAADEEMVEVLGFVEVMEMTKRKEKKKAWLRWSCCCAKDWRCTRAFQCVCRDSYSTNLS
jgi:hypothetical protein